MDIRGWEEMHPLNSVGWSLFFEYIANILYAIGIRKLSKTALGILVLIVAIALAHLAITSPVALVLYMPRIGGDEHLWMNGVYESVCIIIVFPLIVYLGASGKVHSHTEHRICNS